MRLQCRPYIILTKYSEKNTKFFKKKRGREKLCILLASVTAVQVVRDISLWSVSAGGWSEGGMPGPRLWSPGPWEQTRWHLGHAATAKDTHPTGHHISSSIFQTKHTKFYTVKTDCRVAVYVLPLLLNVIRQRLIFDFQRHETLRGE